MTLVADADHLRAAGRAREWMATYEKQRDLILLGAYQKGSDPRTDEALGKIDAINAFLRQGTAESSAFADTRARLLALV
jgi:type III secretion protein N (ATPase)